MELVDLLVVEIRTGSGGVRSRRSRAREPAAIVRHAETRDDRRWIARDGDLEVRRADGSAPTAARAASMISPRPDPRQKTTTVTLSRAIGRPPRAAKTRARGVGGDGNSKV